MRRQVSEKTLELNIAAEFLGIIRGFRGCANAFWMGMKQDQEAKTGIDELIQNVPRGFHLALQFKSPYPAPKDSAPYKFTINDFQNNNLLRLARTRPDAVYYILPHYNTLTTLRASAPNLLGDTWALKVSDLNHLPPSTNGQGTHGVTSYGGRAAVKSETVTVKTINGKNLLDNLIGTQIHTQDRPLLTHEDLKGWLKSILSEIDVTRSTIGQLFRGFSTICIG